MQETLTIIEITRNVNIKDGAEADGRKWSAKEELEIICIKKSLQRVCLITASVSVLHSSALLVRFSIELSLSLAAFSLYDKTNANPLMLDFSTMRNAGADSR